MHPNQENSGKNLLTIDYVRYMLLPANTLKVKIFEHQNKLTSDLNVGAEY